jgi:hypothetical protein
MAFPDVSEVLNCLSISLYIVTCTTHTRYIGVRSGIRTYTRCIGFKGESLVTAQSHENEDASDDGTSAGRNEGR